jgi:hypothetical protein
MTGMNSQLVLALWCACTCAASPCRAQTAAAPAAAAASAASAQVRRPSIVVESDEQLERSEPNVRHVLIEDQGSKIEELRVRGQTQHIVVTPKVGTTKPYEILVAPGGRDMTDGTGGPRNTTGKRVWSLLNF